MDKLDHIPGSQNIDNNTALFTQQTVVLPIIKEEVIVDKQVVENGKVLITKKVFEEDFNTIMPVYREEVLIERIQMNSFIDGVPPTTRVEGEKTIIPILKEVYVKRILLVEELHITKNKTINNININEMIKREEVTVERSNNSSSQ